MVLQKKKKSEIQRKGGHINMLFRIKKVNLDEIKFYLCKTEKGDEK
jgi:hypothetical protein